MLCFSLCPPWTGSGMWLSRLTQVEEKSNSDVLPLCSGLADCPSDTMGRARK